MNKNGKKTGLRVAVLFAVAGATMALAGARSSEGVAMDEVVMVNKDAPQQKGHGEAQDAGVRRGYLLGGGIVALLGSQGGAPLGSSNDSDSGH